MAAKRNETRVAPNRIPPFRLALFGIIFFAAFSLLPLVRSNPRLTASFVGAVAALLLFLLFVRHLAGRSGRVPRYQFLPRPVHYVQFAMHSSIYIYWGWYWREVYRYAPLILAQVAFVYVFDMLLCWSRRDNWILGFGPFPIVLSTNLFLWFRDDWFYLQFFLIATGVLCKEFITWNRDGRRAHIFNPSAVALCIFSIGLLATGTTHLTWGEEVAVSLGRPPHIFIEIFLVGLIVQALFSVTLVTLSAAAALCVLNLAYTHSTGVYRFVDSNIPIATFLGLHLLVTDPATSPRNNLGKVLFGGMYGAGVFGIYAVLGWFGAPTFYDKLLCVPALNLTVQALDRWSLALLARWKFRPWRRMSAWTPRRANFAHMGVWTVLFVAMWATGFVGARHPGADSEFWLKACRDGRPNACRTLVRTATISCQHGSSRACITMGVLLNDGSLIPRNALESAKDFGRACDLGLRYGCDSLASLVQKEGQAPLRSSCGRGDGESCFILGSLHYAGRGVPRDYEGAAALFRQSCTGGWWRGCGALAECYRAGLGTARDPEAALSYFEKACNAGLAPSCFAAGAIYRTTNRETLARERFRQACDASMRNTSSQTAYFRAGTGPETAAAPFCSESER
jgi:Sel1 repeat